MIISLVGNYAISLIKDRRNSGDAVKAKFVSVYNEDNTPVDFGQDSPPSYYYDKKVLKDEEIDEEYSFSNPCTLKKSTEVFELLIAARELSKRKLYGHKEQN